MVLRDIIHKDLKRSFLFGVYMNLMTPGIYRKLIGLIKKNNLIKFYRSKEWRKVRAEKLKQDNYECQSCKRRGKYSKAEVVHHIDHVKDNPRRALDLLNLESLCNVCHNKEHPEKLHSNAPKFKNIERW